MTFALVFLPKSLLLLLSSFLIYDFHVTFDLGLKVRLFARHSAQKVVSSYVTWVKAPEGYVRQMLTLNTW
jgi:hypothetical protein